MISKAEIEKRFVRSGLLFNDHRKNLLNQTIDSLYELVNNLHITDIFIRGSFISDKEKPNDIDIIVFAKKNSIKNVIDKVHEIHNKTNKKIESIFAIKKDEETICPVYFTREEKIVERDNECDDIKHFLDVHSDLADNWKLLKIK